MNTTAIKKWQSVIDFPGNNTPLIIDSSKYEVLTSLRLDSSYTIGSIFKSNNKFIKNKIGDLEFNLEFRDLTEDHQSNFSMILNNIYSDHMIRIGYDQTAWYVEEEKSKKKYSKDLPKFKELNELQLSIDNESKISLIMNENIIIDQYKVEGLYEELAEKPENIFLALISIEDIATKIAIKRNDKQEKIIKNSCNELDDTNLSDKNESERDILESETLKVSIDKEFPRVICYEYKNEILQGELETNKKIKINNQIIKPKVAYDKKSNSEAIYTIKYQSEVENLDFSIDVSIKIVKNELHLNIIEINENENKIIESIEFIDNALVSISSRGKNAQFAGATMSVNTHHAGDIFIDVSEGIKTQEFGTMYGFVSNNKLAAGVWSNSQYSFGGLTEDHTRLSVQTQKKETKNVVKISSAPWYYQRRYKNKPYPNRTRVLPSAKVVITDDLNNDGKIDWQDAAIAYRSIMNNPYGYERVPELVSYRINMNFGSQAQSPFLKVLDGIKRVQLNTDGLGQSILLKGYGNEGHDSGHLNYTDVGQRMGGFEDFKFLMDKVKDYGTDLGVHINVSETYPESPVISEELLRKAHTGQYKYGWNWLDQGINIDSSYDLAHSRYDRLKALKKLTKDGLDFIYVDVWGNFQSGDERAWQTNQIARELNSLDWKLALEWGFAGEYDSVFNHWSVDMPYGGAANNPLLGGYELSGFEGWQQFNNFKSYIETIFKTNLPTKFVQHFMVERWIDGESVKMEDNDEIYYWTPEMEIHLKNQANDNLLIKRKSNDVHSDLYRQRTFILNDHIIFDNDAYLLPWDWNSSGEKLGKNQQKLYYYNLNDSKTEWDVSSYNFEDNKLFVYELSDKGKINEKKVQIHQGKVNLDLKANTPYVIYNKPQKELEIQWSEGMHIKDAGFNSLSLDHWETSSDQEIAKVVYTQGYNPVLEIKDNKSEYSIRQKLNHLKSNTQYVAYVGVDNRSDAKAILRIKNAQETIENFTNKSIAKNYVGAYTHNNSKENATIDDTSYFQNMYVFFSTKDDPENVYLELSREAGPGSTYFADIRILENQSKMFDGEHETKDSQTFEQNFENVPQGIFPFVVGDSEGVEDNRIHLSEKNEPYTQRGWNEKLISDVISDRWSLKTNGLVKKDAVIYQTIPQNYRFMPGVQYEIEFDYEAGSDDTYAFVIGEGESKDKKNLECHLLENTWENHSKAQKVKFELTGASSGQTWIGIYSTKSKANTFDDIGGQAVFKSYSDLIIDNLKIKKN